MNDKKCKICGRENPLWSDEYCHIGCAYRGLEKLAKIGKLALQTELCYWGYQYNDGDCNEEKYPCVRNELCKMKAEVCK